MNGFSQIFDGAQFFAAEEAPELKSASPIPVVPYSPDAERPALEEAERFDWDGYAKHANLSREAAIQSYLGARLPSNAFKDLLLEIRAPALWKFLGEPARRALKNAVLRGFQQTPHLLRHEVVRSRLATHFRENPPEIPALFELWTQEEPPILSHLEGSDGELRERWPTLAKQFGVPALVFGVAARGNFALYAEIVALIRAPNELFERIEAAPSLETNDSPDAETGETQTPPESDEAKFAREKFAELQRVAREANEKAARLERELEALKKQEARHKLTAEKKQQNLQIRLETERDELQKRLERLERRFKKTEAERAELELSARRLQKQLRAANVRLTEEQRRAATLEKKVAEVSIEEISVEETPVEAKPIASAVKTKSRIPSKPSPLDEIFEWEANGRRVRFSVREMKRRLERNDEDAALDVALAVEGADERGKFVAKRFLERLRGAGAWCERAVLGSTTRVLVDASNVARAEKDARGRGNLANLLALRDELRRRDCWPVVLIADASLRHNVNDRETFEQMLQSGEIEQTDKGVEADEVLAREARRTGAYVVTNDAKFFHKVSPDFEPPRVAFRVYDGFVVVDEF